MKLIGIHPVESMLREAVVNVELPAPVTVAGLNEAVTPLGRFCVLSATDVLIPALGATWMVYVADSPGLTFCDIGVADKVKSAAGVIVIFTVAVWVVPEVGSVAMMVIGALTAGVFSVVNRYRLFWPANTSICDPKLAVTPEGKALVLRLTVPMSAAGLMVTA